MLNIEKPNDFYDSNDPMNPNNIENLITKSISEYNKEVTENIENNSSNSNYINKISEESTIAKQIENPNLNLNQILNDQNAFLSYDENGQLIILDENLDRIDLNNKNEEVPYGIEFDEFNDNYLKNNNNNFNNNNSYKANLNKSLSSLNNSGSRVGFFKRSSMTVSDLTDDSKLRKSISVAKDEINTQQNYIEIKDWEFEQVENQEKLENEFKEFENNFFSNYYTPFFLDVSKNLNEI